MGMLLSWLNLILTWLLILPIDDLILVIVFFLASPLKSKSSPLFLVLVLKLNSCSSLWKIVWLRWLLVDKGVHLDTRTPLYCDKQKLLKLAIMKFFMNAPNVEIYCHFPRHLRLGTIVLHSMSSFEQIVDVLTKYLTYSRFTLVRQAVNALTPATWGVGLIGGEGLAHIIIRIQYVPTTTEKPQKWQISLFYWYVVKLIKLTPNWCNRAPMMMLIPRETNIVADVPVKIKSLRGRLFAVISICKWFTRIMITHHLVCLCLLIGKWGAKMVCKQDHFHT